VGVHVAESTWAPIGAKACHLWHAHSNVEGILGESPLKTRIANVCWEVVGMDAPRHWRGLRCAELVGWLARTIADFTFLKMCTDVGVYYPGATASMRCAER
jgi:hypothetical protein